MGLKGQKQKIYTGAFKQAVVEEKFHSGLSNRAIGTNTTFLIIV